MAQYVGPPGPRHECHAIRIFHATYHVLRTMGIAHTLLHKSTPTQTNISDTKIEPIAINSHPATLDEDDSAVHINSRPIIQHAAYGEGAIYHTKV